MLGSGLLKGLGVTIRHFVNSYIYDRRPGQPRYDEEWMERRQGAGHRGLYTIQYPEQKRKLAEAFRFLPMLIYDEKPEDPRCTACGICARVCPPQCIWIERATDDKGRPTARPAAYWIDVTICMSCGLCAEYCPFDAIKMNQEHEITTTDRDRDLMYDMSRLLKPAEYYAGLHPTDYAAEEAARREKEEAKRQAEEARKAAAARPKPAEGAAE